MLKLFVFLSFVFNSYIAAPVLLSEIISSKFSSLSNGKKEDVLSVDVDAVIDESISLNDISYHLLGIGSVLLEGSALLEKKSLFNLNNSTLSLGNLTLKIPESDCLASVGKSSMFEMAQVFLEGCLSQQNLFMVNGGSVALKNVYVKTDSSIISFVKTEELGSNLEVVGMTLNSSKVCGNKALLYSSHTEVKGCSFTNITSDSFFSYEQDNNNPSYIERVSHNSFYNCESVFNGLLLTMDLSYKYISNNNTYKRTLGIHRYGHVYYNGNEGSFDSDWFDNCVCNETAGGGLFFEGEDLNIKGCYFLECESVNYGGGVCYYPYKSSGLFKIQTSDFENCTCNGSGGAICSNEGKISMNKCRFLNCYTRKNKEQFGGSIEIFEINGGSGSYINNCFFDNSEAEDGGSIYINSISNSLKISNCTFFNSTAFTGGSIGIYKPRRGDIIINFCAFKNSDSKYKMGYDIYVDYESSCFNKSSISNCYTNTQTNSLFMGENVTSEVLHYIENPEDSAGCTSDIIHNYQNTQNNDTAEFIWIIIAVVAVVAIVVVIVIVCYCRGCLCFGRCKHKSRDEASNYSGGGNTNDYQNTNAQQDTQSQNMAYVAYPSAYN